MSTAPIDAKRVISVLQQYPNETARVIHDALGHLEGEARKAVVAAAPGATDIKLVSYGAGVPTQDQFQLTANFTAKVGSETRIFPVLLTLQGAEVPQLCAMLCGVAGTQAKK